MTYEPTWHQASIPLRDNDQRSGTVSTFFNYDLGRWLFGWRTEFDPCWYEFAISVGPLEISAIYWRPAPPVEQAKTEVEG